ncbi:hypothetical protein HK405_009481 [Cladochytrium tenue]|nr:hypothetical protein HK405_009481 [Cladochytrium tenue]
MLRTATDTTTNATTTGVAAAANSNAGASTSAPPPPPHRLIEDRTAGQRGVVIANWSITTTKRPISGAADLERLGVRVGIPAPDMFFGANSLEVVHEASGAVVRFDGEAALAAVALAGAGTGEDGAADGLVKVAHAEQWSRSKGDVTKLAKAYDWTFSTDYRGTLTAPSPDIQFVETHTGINVDLLRRPDPILFYDEVVLYEDELADNGACVLNVRVRVMPTCFLVLMRLFLRVDGVLFRVRDTRLFHAFGSPVVIREYREMEEPYAAVKAEIPRPPPWHPRANVEDFSVLTDAAWVAEAMAKLEARRPPAAAAGLRRIVEAVRLVPAASDEDLGRTGAREGGGGTAGNGL